MIISLTGFMGCGKSSVGRKLSELLCCPFMDLDEEIEAKTGRSIPEIFAEDGEDAFRKMELETLYDIVPMPVYSRGPLPADAGPLPLPGGGKMPLAYNRHTSLSSEDPYDESSQDIILALGGGTVMTRECAEIVQNGTICIYLKASVETLVSHLEGETANRPMLLGESLRDRISGLMERRSATYESTAHIIIDTDGKTIDEIAETIIRLGIPCRR